MIRLPHVTRIVEYPLGVNILGLLESFAWVGGIAVSIFLKEDSIQSGPSAVFFVAPIFLMNILIGGFDLWWRRGQPDEGRWKKWLSPHTGGCFLFVPGWLWASLQLVSHSVILVWVLIKRW